MGAGRTETMRAIFGLDPYDEGKIKVHGKEVTIKKVSDSIAQKVVMLSEDRRRYGIIPIRSVMENASILKRCMLKHHLLKLQFRD